MFDNVVFGGGNVVAGNGGFGHQRVLHRRWQAKHTACDGLARVAPGHRRRFAVCTERGRHGVDGQGAVEVMRHVVFTRPHQLHRFVADGFGDQRRLHDEVDVNAPAETAAQERRLDRHVFRLDAHRFGDGRLRRVLPLCGANQRHLAVFEPGGEVHGLQRRVRHVLAHVFSAHHILRSADHRVCITHGLQGQRRAGLGRSAGSLVHGRRVDAGASAFVPDDGQSFARLVGTPPGVGHHGHAVGDLHHIDHAGHGLGLGRIHRFNGAANHRALLQRGVNHAGQLHVNAELGCAVDFGRCVQAPCRFADDGELARVFDGGLLRHRQLGRCGSELPIRGFLTFGANHHAIDGFELAAVNFPFVSRCADQHLAHLRAADAELFPSVAHRSGAAGELRAADQRVAIHLGIRRSDGHLHLAEINVELFGDQHRQRGVNTLAHFGAGRNQGDGVVIGDVHPGIGRVHRACRFRHRERQGETHEQPATANGGGFQEGAARSFQAFWGASGLDGGDFGFGEGCHVRAP